MSSGEVGFDGLDRDALRDAFRARRRVRLQSFLPEQTAASLYAGLSNREDWDLVLCVDGQAFAAPADVRRTCTEEEERDFAEQAYGTGRTQFSFLYDNIGYVPESDTASSNGPSALTEHREIFESPGFMALISDITDSAVRAADLQATRFQAGHFRMFNDAGDNTGTRRIVASLSLTPNWMRAWGGLLQFRGFTGHIEEAHTPGFNVLSIFDVEESHATSLVAPFARAPKYCITTWMKST